MKKNLVIFGFLLAIVLFTITSVTAEVGLCEDTDPEMDIYFRGAVNGYPGISAKNNNYSIIRRDFCGLEGPLGRIAGAVNCSGDDCKLIQFYLTSDCLISRNVSICENGCTNGVCIRLDDELGDDEVGDDEVGDDELGDDEVGDDEVGDFDLYGITYFEVSTDSFVMENEAVGTISIGGNVFPLSSQPLGLSLFISFDCEGENNVSNFIERFPSINLTLISDDFERNVNFNFVVEDENVLFEEGREKCNLLYNSSVGGLRKGFYYINSPVSYIEGNIFSLRILEEREIMSGYVLLKKYGPESFYSYEFENNSTYTKIDYQISPFEKAIAFIELFESSEDALENLEQRISGKVYNIERIKTEGYGIRSVETRRNFGRIKTGVFGGIRSFDVYLFKGVSGEGVTLQGAAWVEDNVFVSLVFENRDYASSSGIDASDFVNALAGRPYTFKDNIQFAEFDKIAQELIRAYLGRYGSTLGAENGCTPEWECAIKPLVCPEYGQQIRSCKDLSGCAEDIEDVIDCTPGICSGCFLGNTCVPYGHRLLNDERVPVYCDIDGNFKAQKTRADGEDLASCQNNHECESNICSSGECIEVARLLREAGAIKGVAIRVLCRLANIFDRDDYSLCINTYLGSSE